MCAQTAMPARTGEEFLQGLEDERQVRVGEEGVRDVAAHPALAGAARFVASLYDLQHEAAPACLMPDPETGYIGSSGRSLQRAHTLAAPDRTRRLVDRFVREEL